MFDEIGDMFLIRKKLKCIETVLGFTDVKVIVDSSGKKKFDQGNLQPKMLRTIHNYFCSNHVAFAKYTCQHKVFFHNPEDGSGFDFPRRCPMRDAGRLLEETHDAV